MKIEDYSPTSHNVWIKEVRPEKTASGLFIPERGFTMETHADMFENKKEHTVNDIDGAYFVVVSTGHKCVEGLQPGDIVLLLDGARREQLRQFQDGSYWSVSEAQLIGYKKKDK